MSNARNLADLLGTNSTIQTAKIADDAITSAKLETNISVDGTLTVTGATTLSSTLGVSGASTLTGNISAGGTYTGSGLMTTGGNIVIPDAGTIGSASDTDALAIASNGVFTQSAPVVCQCHHASQITINDNTQTVMPMDTVSLDTHSLYDATNDRILIPSAFNGDTFLFLWKVTLSGGTSGDNMQGHLQKNGSVVQTDNLFLTGDEGEQITFQGQLVTAVATDDYFDCKIFSDQSSGTRNSLTGAANSSLTAFRLF